MNCPICNRGLFSLFDIRDFRIRKCPDCDFSQIEPYPVIEQVKGIYQQDYFDSMVLKDQVSDSRKKWKFVKKYLKSADTLLDFGCGTGNFLHHCEGLSRSVGYDISEFAAEYAHQVYGLDVVCGEARKDSFRSNTFNIIVCFDVIEHVPNYAGILDYFSDWLVEGGLLILTTPDTSSWDAKILGSRWYGFSKYPEHINFFSKKSLSLLLHQRGFNVLEVRPWGFIRSLKFIQENGLRDGLIKSLLAKILEILQIGGKEIYIPMIDLIVVAKKASKFQKSIL